MKFTGTLMCLSSNCVLNNHVYPYSYILLSLSLKKRCLLEETWRQFCESNLELRAFKRHLKTYFSCQSGFSYNYLLAICCK